MKLIIATPIYPPQVGGPATYSAALRHALASQGHDVQVVTYGSLSRMPTGVRHFIFFLRLLVRSFGCDGIIAFDTYSVGFPAVFVSLLLRAPLVVRVGGDFLWELYVQRTKDLLPLPHIYEQREKWSGKERFVFRAVRFVARHATLAFSSAWQRDLWRAPYALVERRTAIIENAIEPKRHTRESSRKNFLFYTREIALKNHVRFRRAFDKAKEIYPDIELEEGMIPRDALMDKICEGYAAVLPSISDITPNYIVDALRCGKPFLLTKYSAYAQKFAHYGVIVDPLDEADMARGIERLADPDEYRQLQERVRSFDEVHTYADIAREFVALFN